MQRALIFIFTLILGFNSSAFSHSEGLSEEEKKYIDEYLEQKKLQKNDLSLEENPEATNREFTQLNIPGNLDFYGFVQTEYEDADNLGSDGGRITSTPFDSTTKTDRITEANTFANLGLDWELQRTTAHFIIELGEYAAGLTDSSGQLGADASDIEVKNIYLEHDFNNGWMISAGIQGIVADPRGLIMDDDQSAFTATYTFNDSAKVWGYIAETDTGTTRRITDDQQFYGFNAELKHSNCTSTPFWIHLKDRSTDNEDKVVDFLGFHNVWESGDWAVETQFIYNQGRILSTGGVHNRSTSLRGHLTDLKITKSFEESVLSSLSFEWLHTSGGRQKTATSTSKGRQFHFQSQDPQVAYLLNIADSDGSDDAPGTEKVANINLAFSQGINILVLEANLDLSEKLSGYLRQGYLTTDVGDSQNGTGVRFIGREINAGAAYQITDYLKVLIDCAYFKTGAFFSPNSDAYLFTSALRFDF